MTEENKYENHKHLLWYSLSEHLAHGMDVSNLAYEIAREMGVSEEDCHELARAGMIHDIGKVTLMGEPELEGNPLVVEEMHYVRLHPHKGYLVALETAIRIQFARAFCTTTRIMTAAAIPTAWRGGISPWAPGSCGSAMCSAP